MAFELAKLDADQCLVFGFANVSIAKDGALIEDLQADIVPPAELEKAAYDFVLNFREADEMHVGEAVGHLVESMVFTPEKLEQLGLAKNAIPPRWWVGFKLAPDSFAKVKSGQYRMFSIAGSADRVTR